MSLDELRAAIRGPRPRDVTWDALCEALGMDPDGAFTTTSRSVINRVVKELKEIEASPDEITRRARRWRVVYPTITLTATALVKHWPALVSPVPTAPRVPVAPELECAPVVSLDDWKRLNPDAVDKLRWGGL